MLAKISSGRRAAPVSSVTAPSRFAFPPKLAADRKWRLLVLLPLGFALDGTALAADPVPAAKKKAAPPPAKEEAVTPAAKEKAAELPPLRVVGKATADAGWGYRAAKAYSGTKTDTPLIETPQSISVVTEAQMDAQNTRSLAEALRYTPGMQSESFGFEPRVTWLKMRGFDATTSGLFRDGLRLANLNFVIGYNLEPYGAERVEVPRGPVSVLFGQVSPGGLVNYVSKRPSFDPFREISFQAGSFGRLQGMADFGGSLDDGKTLAYRLTALGRDADTQVNFVPDDRVYVAPALTWKPSDATTFTLLTHYQKDDTKSSQRLPAQGTLRTNPNGKIPTNLFTGEPNVDQYYREEYAVGYVFEHHFNEIFTVRQNLRYYDNQTNDSTIFPTSLLPNLSTVTRALYQSFGKLQGFNLDNHLQANFATGILDHTLLAGLDYQHVDATTLQTYGAAPDLDLFDPVYGKQVPKAPVFKNEALTQNQTGLYLQDQMKLTERWRILGGVRHDLVDDETQNRLTSTHTAQTVSKTTGRAGLVYLSEYGLAPYFSYATSFLPVIGSDAAGQAFKPETGEQYEFGVKFQPAGSNSSLTLAYFDLTRQNFITPNPLTFQNVQGGEARSQGVELEGVASFENGLNLTASYTYLNARVTQSSVPEEVGEHLEYVPENKAVLWADYTIPTGMAKGFGIGGGTRFIGRSWGNSFGARNDIEIPSYVLFDAAMHYTWGPVRLALNIQNLLDKEYVTTAFLSGGEWTTYGPIRMVAGTISYRF
jgi:iron complex outermembrane receptor protein